MTTYGNRPIEQYRDARSGLEWVEDAIERMLYFSDGMAVTYTALMTHDYGKCQLDGCRVCFLLAYAKKDRARMDKAARPYLTVDPSTRITVSSFFDGQNWREIKNGKVFIRNERPQEAGRTVFPRPQSEPDKPAKPARKIEILNLKTKRQITLEKT